MNPCTYIDGRRGRDFADSTGGRGGGLLRVLYKAINNMLPGTLAE